MNRQLSESRNMQHRYLARKRAIDIFLALLLLLTLSPIFLAIALLLIIVHQGKSPIYIQSRALVLEHDIFRIYKFRTIRNDDVAVIDTNDVFVKKAGACSISAFCRFLRKTGLDELPQLINILKGDMSFIGPRPFSVSDLKIMKNEFINYYAKRATISSKPGITGYWQVWGNRDLGISNLVEMDAAYDNNCSAILDMRIALKTIPIILCANHSDAYLSKDTRDMFKANVALNTRQANVNISLCYSAAEFEGL